MKALKTVQFVVDKHLCTACGGCCGVCPEEAIRMEIDAYGIYTPIINLEKCSECGLCVQVCPGHEFNYWEYQERVFNAKEVDPAIGHYIDLWAGETTDPEIHYKSQSGGLISAMLIYCLEKGIADGAVVTRWSKSDPFKPEVYIAKNREEVLDAVGSKYNPIPAAKILRELINLDGKYIFVGTPCQIQSLRKAEKLFPQLRKKVMLYLGLHCAKVFNYHYHDQIIYKIKDTKNNINSFRFRDKAWRGWPCDMRLINKNGQVYNLTGPFSRSWAWSFFSNYRCQLCFDKFNEFSDISCGDCRVASKYGTTNLKDVYYKNNPGKSDIVIRSQRGKVLFDSLVQGGYFKAEPTERADIIKTVKVAEKKLGVNDFRLFAKLFKLAYPYYGVKFILSEPKDRALDMFLKPWSVIASSHYYLCHTWMKSSLFRNVLKRIPHKLLFVVSSARELPVSHVYFRRTIKFDASKMKETSK